MSKNKQKTTQSESNWRAYIFAALLATLAGFFAVYVNFTQEGNRDAETSLTPRPPIATPSPTDAGSLTGLNSGAMATFLVHSEPRDVPVFSFTDGEGKSLTLKAWRGKTVLLNFWATWCLPCLKEMPALDNLKAAIGESTFDVVAVSLDRGGIGKPRKFLEKIKAKHLALFHDGSGKLNAKLRIVGMPTSLLIDKNGREIGRLVGPAEWDSEDAVRLMRAATSAD